MGERTWGEPCGRMLDQGRCGGVLRRGPGRNEPACMKPLGAGAGVGEGEYFACAQSTLASARWLPGCWVSGRGQARQEHCAAHVGADVARGRVQGLGQGWAWGRGSGVRSRQMESCLGGHAVGVSGLIHGGWAGSSRREQEGLSNSRRGRAPWPLCGSRSAWSLGHWRQRGRR